MRVCVRVSCSYSRTDAEVYCEYIIAFFSSPSHKDQQIVQVVFSVECRVKPSAVQDMPKSATRGRVRGNFTFSTVTFRLNSLLSFTQVCCIVLISLSFICELLWEGLEVNEKDVWVKFCSSGLSHGRHLLYADNNSWVVSSHIGGRLGRHLLDGALPMFAVTGTD